MKSALLVVDVQRGLFQTTPAPADADAVVARIDGLAARARAAGVPVVFVHHEGEGGALAYGSPAWQIDPRLTVGVDDVRVRKTTPDSFLRTELAALLTQSRAERLVICGYASEFCIDTTTRRAAALGFSVVLVADAHTTHEKAHASGDQIRDHHNATLCAMKSFGPIIEAQAAEAISFAD